MKTLILFTFLLVTSFTTVRASITAEGDCDTVKYTGGMPYYQNNLFSTFSTPSNCRAIAVTNAMLPRFYLQKYDFDLSSWSTVSGPITGPNHYFAGVSHGTYRLYVEIPVIYLTIGCGEREPGPILIYNLLGQHIGYAGSWYGDNSGAYYSNSVIVGSTDEDDIKYFFVDVPETGSESTYDDGEQVTIDISNCTNFNQWWLAIFESGPTYNRYTGVGWNWSTPTSLDLTDIWDHAVGWDFEPYHSYTVQFAIENEDCVNSSWNNLDRVFFICPTGTGCRLGEEKVEMAISPNPATSSIYLQNFRPDPGRKYQIFIVDFMGRQVKNSELTSNEIDISDLQNGIFSAIVTQDNQQIFVSKVIVTH